MVQTFGSACKSTRIFGGSAVSELKDRFENSVGFI